MEKLCTIYDLGFKEVINLNDGRRLGYVRDAEIDIDSGSVRALVIPGRLRFFGLLGRESDIIVPWSSIERLGEDIIFIRHELTALPPAKRGRNGPL